MNFYYRLFVYFLMVTYCQLTIAPSFIFARGSDILHEIHVPLNLCENAVLRPTVKSEASALWQSQKAEHEKHLTYGEAQIEGDVLIRSDKAVVEVVKKLRNVGWLKKVEAQDSLVQPSFMNHVKIEGSVTKAAVQEEHHHDVKKSSGPGKFLATAIAIGITWATGGMDCGLAAQAAISATATQMTLGTLSNDFNPLKAAQQMATAEGLKSLGVNVATSVLSTPK